MRANFSTKHVRKLIAAEGYLDLGLPENALQELNSIEDAGLYEAPRQFMIGQVLKYQGRFEEAIKPFENAARAMPSPARRIAWHALVDCYRECGNDELADLAEQLAGPPVGTVQVQLPQMRYEVEMVEDSEPETLFED